MPQETQQSLDRLGNEHKAKSRLTRRTFLTRVGLSATAAAAAPTLIPGSALGLNGYVPPSGRIVLGGIGIGNRGTGVLRWMLPEKDVQFVAVCDARKSRRQAVKKMVDEHYGNSGCAMYSNMRDFLTFRPDIDAVLIATGDRWHALASIWAMRAGKDVYSEKPSSMTIAEGQGVVDAARRYSRIYQTGTQRLSEENFTFANELLRLGYLGRVHTVRAHLAPWDQAEMRHDWLVEQPLPSREELDWDAWLGPCPWRPYNEEYVNGGWRGHYDFHTSCIGEWGAHTIAQCQVAIGAAHTSGISYKYVNNPTGDGMVVRYAKGVDMVLQRDGWHGSCGVRYEGSEGWVSIADGYNKPEVSNPTWMLDFKKLVNDYIARTQRPMNHVRDFFDCIKSRRPTVSGPEMMHRSMSTVHAANASMWLKRDMRYDPDREEFVGDPEANRLRTRSMRSPYMI